MKLVPRALVAQTLPGRISRATPRASAAIRVLAFSGRSAAVEETVAAADVRIAEVAVLTAVAVVPIAADALAEDRVLIAVGQVARGTIVATKVAIPARLAVRSSFPRC